MATTMKMNRNKRCVTFIRKQGFAMVILASLCTGGVVTVDAQENFGGKAAPQAEELFGREPQLVLETGGFPGGITDVAFSPDNNQLAVSGVKIVRVFSVDTGELITTIRGDRSRSSYGATNTLCYSPDGQYLLVGVYDYNERGSIRIYRTDNLAQIDRLLPGHTSPCTNIHFSRDGKTMVTSEQNGEIFIWDWASKKVIRRIPPTNPDKPIIDSMAVTGSPAFFMAVKADTIEIFNAVSGQMLTPQSDMPPLLLGWWADILTNGVAWPLFTQEKHFPRRYDLNLENGIWCAYGQGGSDAAPKFYCGVWKARPWIQGAAPIAPKTLYRGHKWRIDAIKFSRDGSLIASGDKFGEVHIWASATGEVKQIIKNEGQPYYEAAFNEKLDGIVLGNKPDRKNWTFNNYGTPERILDLSRRTLRAADEKTKYITETPSRGNVSVGLVPPRGDGQSYLLTKNVGGKKLSSYRLPDGRHPSVYTLLEKPALGVKQPVLYGDSDGTVELWDTSGSSRRRFFQGHHSMITSISVAPGEKVFVTGSTDHTIRIWSLLNYKSNGFLDFEFQNSAVYKLRPGSSSQRAGVREGDVIRKFDGKTMDEVFELMMLGRFDYKPGQVVPITMQRDEKEYTYKLNLAEGFDYVEPLLNVYLPNDHEWIIWTPKGYYDCSPGADRYIGWHVNQGPDKAAKFYKAEQFKKELYRPDIINEIVNTGDVDLAIKIASSKYGRRSQGLNLTDENTMRENAPPIVVFSEPVQDDPTDRRITLSGTVTTTNDKPITKVTLLHNGVPAQVFDSIAHNSEEPFQFSHRCLLFPGRNVFSAIAENSVSSSNPDEAKVEMSHAGAAEKSKVYALAIGISKYANSGKDFQNLNFADKDAKEFVAVLEKHREGQIYHEVETKVLVNEEATRRNILEGFQWLVDNVKPGDVVMIFAAGHGFMENDKFYLGTHEVDKSSLRATGVSWREVVGTLHEELPACKRIVFLDACHSAGVANSDMRNPLHDLSSPELGTIFFASSTVQEESFEDAQWNHGVFTKSLIDLIGDEKADFSPQTGDGLLSALELESGVVDRVVTMTRDRQHPVVFVPISLRSNNILELLQGK